LKFEHIVAVNEPTDPTLRDLSREELWFGLLYRAEDPRPFLPGLEDCCIVARKEHVLWRELDFGGVRIRDKVTLEPLESVTFEAEKTQSHAGGILTIAIEEPQPDELVLRFTYRTTLPDNTGRKDDMYAEFVKSAYHESDIDTVRVIRMIAESGEIQ